MSENHPKTTTFTAAGLLVLALFVLAAPPTLVRALIDPESRWIISVLGASNARWIAETGEGWYDHLIVDSGAAEFVSNQFLVSEAERERSGALRKFGAELWFPYIVGRGDVLVTLLHQAMYRVALIVLWMPFFILSVVAAVIDGMMEWKKRKYTFIAASPVIHSLGFRIPGMVIVAGMVLVITPLPVMHPMLPPILMAFIAVLLRGSAIHTQRIV